MKWIKDPIYGYIKAKDEELLLINSPILQRLRRIKQLAFVNLVYPSANHTRFEHSLGTMHLAGIMAEELGLDKDFYRICGFLHDVGHGPFSHLSEFLSIIYLNKTHEETARDIIKENKDLLLNYTWKEIYKEISGEGIGIIHGDFDADRLDYLNRDAYHTGNPMGISDALTLIRNMVLENKRIVILERGVGVAESILLSRSFMRRYVYFHKTNLSAQAMVLKAMLDLVEEGVIDVKEFLKMDDYQADSVLRTHNLYRKVLDRDLFKLLISIRISKDYRYKEFVELNEELSGYLENFVTYPPLFKKKEFAVNTLVKVGNEIVKFSEISSYYLPISMYEEDFNRFYVFVDKKEKSDENKKKVEDLINEYFGNT